MQANRVLNPGDLVSGCYAIQSIAGSGGMGIVYRARDLKLQRTVALKFLPADLEATPQDKARFLREARTASSLDHPNIGVIHAVEDSPDCPTYIVMAFYEGQSLAQHLAAGKLPAREALQIASQVACGLSEAHSHGITHRDIKPSNIMLTASGTVKIVDFGLARAVSAETASHTGITGTVYYMSPEQTLGRDLDHRSDQWALGVVLVEMLTGRNPFQAETFGATVNAILHNPPPAIDFLPLELQRIVYRALAKDRDDRYPDCNALRHDLEAALPLLQSAPADAKTPKSSSTIRRARLLAAAPGSQRSRPWHSTAAWLALVATLLLAAAGAFYLRGHNVILANSPKRIAVLPFDTLGAPNPTDLALSQGLVDSFSGKLSNLEAANAAIWIVPASEVRRRNITDPAAALQQLGATLAVKGSIQRDGQAIRLTVNLIDAKNLRQLSSEELNDPAGNLATLQDQAVEHLARRMAVPVNPNLARNTGSAARPAAYEHYLTALGYMQRYDKPGNLDLAVAALQNSIATDPNFALGYAQLGEAYRLKYQTDKNTAWLPKAEESCRKAVQLAPDLPTAYITLAQVHDISGKHELALQELQQALRLDPANPSAVRALAHSYERLNRIADADTTLQQAIALRPDNWDLYNSYGAFLLRQKKFPHAAAQFQAALQLAPDNSALLINLGGTYLSSRDPALLPLAEGLFQHANAIAPSYAAYSNLGDIYTMQHKYAEAAAATEQALALNDKDFYVWANLLNDYEWLGLPDKTADARRKMTPLVEQDLKVNPQNAAAHAQLASLYATAHQKEKSLAHIRTTLALSPNDPENLSSVAATFEKLGDHVAALQYIRKAVKAGLPPNQLRSDHDLQSALADPALRSTLK